MRNLCLLLASAFCLFFGQPSAGLAKSLYVSLKGDDNASGLESAPFKTITHASRFAVAGDTVFVGPGIYYETVEISSRGTATARVRYQPLTPGSVTIDGSKAPIGTDAVSIVGDYVEFDGFNIQKAGRSGISVWGVSGVIVSNNTVSESRRSGIWVGTEAGTYTTDNIIRDNIVFANCSENVARVWPSGWPRAIAVDLSHYAQVDRNIVFQNHGEGIGLLSSDGSWVTNNVTFDNFSVNIYLDNAPNSNVRWNLIFATGDPSFQRDNKVADGVVIANEATAVHLPSRGITVTDNTLVGVGDVFYGLYGLGTGLQDSRIKPNYLSRSMGVSDLTSRIHHATGRSFDLARFCGRLVICVKR